MPQKEPENKRDRRSRREFLRSTGAAALGAGLYGEDLSEVEEYASFDERLRELDTSMSDQDRGIVYNGEAIEIHEDPYDVMFEPGDDVGASIYAATLYDIEPSEAEEILGQLSREQKDTLQNALEPIGLYMSPTEANRNLSTGQAHHGVKIQRWNPFPPIPDLVWEHHMTLDNPSQEIDTDDINGWINDGSLPLLDIGPIEENKFTKKYKNPSEGHHKIESELDLEVDAPVVDGLTKPKALMSRLAIDANGNGKLVDKHVPGGGPITVSTVDG